MTTCSLFNETRSGEGEMEAEWDGGDQDYRRYQSHRHQDMRATTHLYFYITGGGDREEIRVVESVVL